MVLPPLSPAAQPTKRWFAVGALVLGLGLGMAAVADPQDAPSRVGRVARVQGEATLYLPPEPGYPDAEAITQPLNWPITRGQSLVTEDGSSAEISVGPVRLRLDARTELRILELDRHDVRIDLRHGTVAVLMPESDDAREMEIRVDSSRIRPKGRGLFRVDWDPGQDPIISVETGSVTLEQPDSSLTLRAGQTVQWQSDGDWRRVSPRQDAFARWAMQDDLPGPPRFVSSDTTGFEDLERHGRWKPTREWGMAWFPDRVSSAWAPYSQGRWAWVSPWGWTWIDAAPWGFATSHYGRWIEDHGRWGWLPDDVTRPVFYAPAMVTWSQEPPPSSYRYARQAEFAPGYFWTPLRPNERYQTVILPQRTQQGERRYPHQPRQEEPRILAPTRIGPTAQPIITANPQPIDPREAGRERGRDDRRHDRPGNHDIRADGIRLAPGLQAPAAMDPPAVVTPQRPPIPLRQEHPTRDVPHIQPALPIQQAQPPAQVLQPARPVMAPALPATPALPAIQGPSPAARPVIQAPAAIPATPATQPAVPEAPKEERKHRHEENR
ncbi:MAG: DUF6600 domain-containing protein [Leptothrix ochracea]|uniref:DUF6600 domain-containing protein n=1 Tax=Leptothrix ochracea TaxID=735331 RepID=UPI0034E1DA89